MNISLCMIVKDEEEHLREALESVNGYVDEIVIVDTGSTDGTVDIAKEYADVFKEIDWNGFANARNVSLDLANNELILVLDADETVRNPEVLEETVEKVIEEECEAVAFHIVNKLPENQILEGDIIPQIRLFLNRPEYRYVGSVHNQIASPLKENPYYGDETKFLTAPIYIDHKGYSLDPEEMQKKYRSRISMLKQEVEKAEREGNDRTLNYYLYQTANAFFMLKDYDTCLAWAREIDFDKMTEQNAYSACIMACHSAYTLSLHEEAQRYAKQMLELRPQEALSMLFMGMGFMIEQKWFAAYVWLGSTMAIVDMLGPQMKYKVDRAYVCAPAGECALKLKRFGEAKNLFREHLNKYPDADKVRELEEGIVPINEVNQNGKDVIDPDALEEESIQIPDSRTTG